MYNNVPSLKVKPSWTATMKARRLFRPCANSLARLNYRHITLLFRLELRVLAACGIWSDSLEGATASMQKEGLRRPTITVMDGRSHTTPEKDEAFK
jgi:hypothetical protein